MQQILFYSVQYTDLPANIVLFSLIHRSPMLQIPWQVSLGTRQYYNVHKMSRGAKKKIKNTVYFLELNDNILSFPIPKVKEEKSFYLRRKKD